MHGLSRPTPRAVAEVEPVCPGLLKTRLKDLVLLQTHNQCFVKPRFSGSHAHQSVGAESVPDAFPRSGERGYNPNFQL